MKGPIVCCLNEMAVEKFGIEVWQNVLEKSGFSKETAFKEIDDVPDGKFMEMVNNLCGYGNVGLDRVADAFGEYWAGTYAPRVYRCFFIGIKNAKDFLLRVDTVHDIMVRAINASPPKFSYEINEHSLIMTYKSNRNLIPFFRGLLKGVGKHFNEDLELLTISPNTIEIVFPNKEA